MTMQDVLVALYSVPHRITIHSEIGGFHYTCSCGSRSHRFNSEAAAKRAGQGHKQRKSQ
ncbi:hypothetical protein ACWGDX_13225 [Streptomyces sp. NPDC055025]